MSRYTLHTYLATGTYPKINAKALPNILRENRACFVTLKKRQTGLRGCIGLFETDQPLFKNVMERSVYAALHDPRFRPLAMDELKNLKIEISVLTVPQKLNVETPEALLHQLRPKIDGVIIQTPYGSSTYLPQVWEQLPHTVSFLSHLCEKQGAPADFWRTNFSSIRVSTYQAIHFEEADFGTLAVGKTGAMVGKKGALVLGQVPLEDGKGGCIPGPRHEGEALPPGTILSSTSDISVETP